VISFSFFFAYYENTCESVLVFLRHCSQLRVSVVSCPCEAFVFSVDAKVILVIVGPCPLEWAWPNTFNGKRCPSLLLIFWRFKLFHFPQKVISINLSSRYIGTERVNRIRERPSESAYLSVADLKLLLKNLRRVCLIWWRKGNKFSCLVWGKLLFNYVFVQKEPLNLAAWAKINLRKQRKTSHAVGCGLQDNSSKFQLHTKYGVTVRDASQFHWARWTSLHFLPLGAPYLPCLSQLNLAPRNTKFKYFPRSKVTAASFAQCFRSFTRPDCFKNTYEEPCAPELVKPNSSKRWSWFWNYVEKWLTYLTGSKNGISYLVCSTLINFPLQF